MKGNSSNIALLRAFTVIIVASLTIASLVSAAVYQRTYTLDADFDEGALVNVEHQSINDQLQIVRSGTLPLVWVPNEDETISKVDAETGKELARYRTGPAGFDGEPSRTAIDLQGNCWVGNRYAGTVLKIGLYEAGQWVDRNHDGIIQTSRDLNSDGQISGGEILPWGQDECVLLEILLIPGQEAVYVPGTFPGPYKHDLTASGPLALAVDASNNLWAGCWGSQKYYYIDGATGAILKTLSVSAYGHRAHGAVIDRRGVVWSACLEGSHVLWIDPSTNPPTIGKVNVGHAAYGLALDYLPEQHLFVSGWENSKISRINAQTKTVQWTKVAPFQTRSLVCTEDNDFWVANSWSNTVLRYDNNMILKATVSGFSTPTGVAVDAAGKIWCADLNTEYVHRIDPATNGIDLSKRIVGSGGHYAYSDMTCVSQAVRRTGTWTVVFDSQRNNARWDKVSWNDLEPAGTSLAVRVRSSNDQTVWSDWEIAGSTTPLSAVPNGRYLQVETTLNMPEGENSPILYDLTVATKRPKPEMPIPLFQAYPGDSKGKNVDFLGHAGLGGDLLSSAPGVLSIVPGDGWSNYVPAAEASIGYVVNEVQLKKTIPRTDMCPDWVLPNIIWQRGASSVRLWWPLMFEVPSTTWELRVFYSTSVPWDDDDTGPNPPTTSHTEVWSWVLDADLQHMQYLLELFHELPFGLCEVPLISDEDLYVELTVLLANVASYVSSDPTRAASYLAEFELLLLNNEATTCLKDRPDYGGDPPNFGVVNTECYPALCLLLIDSDYVGKKLGLFEP